ncbi:rRNA small subunit methyltransferase B [Kineosporia rhizophila]|uniref:RsmB/NOP family class I SAM-dependent RNA methyltransferase n=1 Tax=Kineosporia TaxID=49184 RepID=UPI001E5F0FF5|nr:transcription antitermination factor NusB [Kineosporia sp. NBRC 101677]MCE0540573.1 rRNA small subunit methyltransferase B [Kineosporia rhizophila]GLY17294.1 rRNA cytosine-C5-methyltransferase [Kineosporia sp. NBRC 101677]
MSKQASAGRPSNPPRRAGGKPGRSGGRDAAQPGRTREGAGSRPSGGRPVSVDPARKVAYETLRAVTERDAYANLILPGMLRRAHLRGRDAGLATELAYGALRGRGSYDAIIAGGTDRPLAEIDPAVLDALRLGVHQLLHMRVPPHAAVSTTVDLVRSVSGSGASRFANAVLRRVGERDEEEWMTRVAPDPATNPDGNLSVRYSHPEWIVRALRDALRGSGRPAEELPALLAAHNARPAVAAAALPGLSDVDELTDGPHAQAGLLSPVAAVLKGAPDDVAAIRQGRARVQDEGSQLVALAAANAATTGTDRGIWLDLCAGPGGKAALLAALLAERHAAGLVGDDAELVAVEAAEHRAGLVQQSLAAVRAAYDVRVRDGRTVGEAEPGRYDRVLVDVPCTGLGALRRRPESRWRRTPADLTSLAPLQRALLESALAAVRPGGVVAYATCSPHPAETRLVVEDVLRGRDDVERLDSPGVLRDLIGSRRLPDHDDLMLGEGPDVQLWTHLHGTDSMYLSLLRRRS